MNKEEISLLRKETVITVPSHGDDIGFDEVKLPSRGLIYGEEHPLCGETAVEFKAMNAMSENILASKSLMKKGTVIPTLIKSCLVNQAIDPLSLILGDKAALLLAIRISGFGPEYRIKTVCPSCTHTFVHEFDLTQVELKFLKKEPIEPNKNLFEMTLPKSKKIIQFALLTDADDLDIMKTQQNRKKVTNSDIDTRVTDEMQRSFRSVGSNEDREYVTKFVREMSVQDSRAFRKYVRAIEPGIDMEQEVTCVKCGETDSHTIYMTTEFFWPVLES